MIAADLAVRRFGLALDFRQRVGGIMKSYSAAFAAAFVFLSTHAAAQTLPPVEAFGSLPFISQPQLSPDGKHFAAMQVMDGLPVAAIYTVNSNAPPQVFGAQEDAVVAGISWAKNDRLVIYYKTAKYAFGFYHELLTFYRTVAVDADGRNWAELLGKNHSVVSNISTGVIADKNLSDPNTILMPLWTQGTGGTWRLSLYSVDVHSGVGDLLQEGTSRGEYWITDGNGGVAGRVDLTRDPLTDHLMLYRGSAWTDVREFDAREDRGANVAGLTFDGTSLAIVAPNTSGHDSLIRIDRESGQNGATLFGDDRYDLAESLIDEWTGRVIGAAYADDKMEYTYFVPQREALQRGIEKVFPGQDAHAMSVTQAGDKAIVAVESPDQPRTYYFLDRDTHVATKIASEYPNLRPGDLGQMNPYPYKARDGLSIPAYLTVPPGRPAKNLPLVVMPHGGPDDRDVVGFDWWAQFLANRGYAVFQPNYRGSSGYGRAFEGAGLHQWGLKMQDDITDGVKRLIADGVVDPKRICIVGASYGGYAALAGATFTPDLYASAVSIAGPSDLTMMMRDKLESNGVRSRAVSFWESRIGSLSGDWDRLEATSPALHADRVRVPVLLMHGKLDTTVPYSQGEEEEDALKRAGKHVEFVTFEHDDHYLRLAETRIAMLTALETFLRANIGN
jgi:dipeptidyl aminopeptidase/acylaminoacyl peptidase